MKPIKRLRNLKNILHKRYIDDLWVEVSYLDADFESVHDWDLDCGGETAEDAINNLYDLVVAKFGEPK